MESDNNQLDVKLYGKFAQQKLLSKDFLITYDQLEQSLIINS